MFSRATLRCLPLICSRLWIWLVIGRPADQVTIRTMLKFSGTVPSWSPLPYASALRYLIPEGPIGRSGRSVIRRTASPCYRAATFRCAKPAAGNLTLTTGKGNCGQRKNPHRPRTWDAATGRPERVQPHTSAKDKNERW